MTKVSETRKNERHSLQLSSFYSRGGHLLQVLIAAPRPEDHLNTRMKAHSQKDSASAEKEKPKLMKRPQTFHRALLCRQQPSGKHASSCTTVVVGLEGSSKRVTFEQQPKREKSSVVIRLPAKVEKMASKGTQTDYRESEVQTSAWKHEVKAEGSILQELLSLDWLSSEKNFPLGMEELRLIEATRQQLAWENVIKRLRGPENERRRRSLVLRTTWAAANLKDSRREEEIRQRIDLSRRSLREAREAFQEQLQSRLSKSYGCLRMENDTKIHYWHHQLTREIRKMKSARSRSATKPDVVAVYRDKASDLYAPKLRDGQNPSLRHEVIQIHCRYLKRFHGLEILERHLSDIPHPKLSKSRRGIQSLTPKQVELCPRKFREKVIAKASEEHFDGRSLRVPAPSPTPGGGTTMATRVPSDEDAEDHLQQASLLLKRLIRGRAVQTEKFSQVFRTM